MGQQQLLLLVIGVVVAIQAVVIGINAYQENLKKRNMDSLVNDAMTIGCDAQVWRVKPAVNGGGANNPYSDQWAGLTLGGLGYKVDSDGKHTNMHGTITMTNADNKLTIVATNADHGNKVTVVVSGMSLKDLELTIDSTYKPSS